jgi:hypothetical protein
MSKVKCKVAVVLCISLLVFTLGAPVLSAHNTGSVISGSSFSSLEKIPSYVLCGGPNDGGDDLSPGGG